ncbi:hypothetical protein [Blastococcus sp. TF02A-35]|uniref:hypothetical protein n=1 Tax=Blastococcus sp. TF02A-35 TaxID=2559612 RepID=UPI001ADDB01F|nr:hypothetical protein [Blastococcus sp. TF02A_35]
MASFTVVYDANVLYPNLLRDLLIRVAQAGLVRARWTDEILDEVFWSLSKSRPDLDPERLARTRTLMNEAIEMPWSPATSRSLTSSTSPTPTTGTSWPPRSRSAPR